VAEDSDQPADHKACTRGGGARASSRASFPTLCIDDSVLQSYLRSVVAERNRLARELRKTQTKCNKLEEKAQRLKREVDRLKGKLEESARAAKRQAAPFSKGRREKDPKPPGRNAVPTSNPEYSVLQNVLFCGT